MRRNIRLFALAFLVLVTGANAGQYNRVVDIGAELPEFSDLPAADGSSLSSAEIEQEVLVLVFLANHCPWVKGMDADLVKFVEGLGGKSVRVVGISVNHRVEDRLPAMQSHAEASGYNFTYLFDESQELGRKLGATKTPEYFVFDAARELVYMGLLHDSPAMKRSDGSIHYTKGAPGRFFAMDAVLATLDGKVVEAAETKAQGCSVEYE